MRDVSVEVAKAIPPITVGTLSFGGVALNEWVLICTLVYVLLQMYILVRDKLVRDVK